MAHTLDHRIMAAVGRIFAMTERSSKVMVLARVACLTQGPRVMASRSTVDEIIAPKGRYRQ